MRRLVRHVLVWTVAFALVASAAAWNQCTAMQLTAAGMASAAHPDHHMHAEAAAGDHHAMHHEHAPPAHTDDHGCAKCCSMCTVANAMLPAAAEAVTFTISPAVFFSGYEDWSANTVAVDPGIPKRVV